LPALFNAVALGTPAAFAKVQGITPQIIEAVTSATQTGYAAAYSYVYYTAIAFGVVATLCACALKPMDHFLTSHVPKRVVNPREQMVKVGKPEEVNV
jgi:hypothetical protein